MSELLPLFPVSVVLFPGEPRALYAFEDRHRHLVRDVQDSPGTGRIGVIAIREGSEIGPDGARSLYEVGCAAALRRVRTTKEGRLVLVTAGAARFQLISQDHSRPYPCGEVSMLAEDTGDQAAALVMAGAVQRAFRGYLAALGQPDAAQRDDVIPDLSGDPVALSWMVAEMMTLGQPARQSLLAQPDALSRLTAERALLARETTLARTLGSAPAPNFRHSHLSSN
jgi:uncharacterized protein